MTTVTLDLDDDVLQAVRDEAARTGRPSAEIVAAAVRRYVRPSILDELRTRPGLDEDAGMALALQEVRAVREERRPSRVMSQ